MKHITFIWRRIVSRGIRHRSKLKSDPFVGIGSNTKNWQVDRKQKEKPTSRENVLDVRMTIGWLKNLCCQEKTQSFFWQSQHCVNRGDYGQKFRFSSDHCEFDSVFDNKLCFILLSHSKFWQLSKKFSVFQLILVAEMFCLLLECAFDLILFVLWWKLYVHVARKRRCSFLSLTVTSIACVIVWLNCAFICRMIIVLLLFYGNVITIFTCLNHRIVQSVWMRLLLRTTQTILIFSVEKEKTHLSESSISEISNSVSVVWAHWEVNVFWFVMLTLILMLLIGYSGNSVHRKKIVTITQSQQHKQNKMRQICSFENVLWSLLLRRRLRKRIGLIPVDCLSLEMMLCLRWRARIWPGESETCSSELRFSVFPL